jgi:serine/threonine-protein kinase
MEELEGVSLASVLHADGPLAFDRAGRILAQVCRALGAAHGHGIVHRDLKPDNVVVLRRDDGADFVKVVDFGISKSAGDGEDRLTRAGTVIGTPEYMAPEQGAAAVVDHRADVYAFGVLAYELVTGSLPFQGPTAIAILIEHQTRPPEAPSRRRDGVPPELEALILRCLEKRPQNRYQSMEEVGGQLSLLLSRYGLPPVYDKTRTPPPRPVPPGFTVRFHTPVRGSRGGTVSLEPLPPPSGQLVLVPEQPEIREARRRAGRRLALGVALLAGLAAVAAWVSFALPRPEEALRTVLAVQNPPAPPTPTATAAPTPTATAAPTPTPAAMPAPASTGTLTAAAATSDIAVPKVAARPAAGKPRPAARPAPTSAPSPGRREVGSEPATDDNPYGKLNDLKPDPF